jgi:hypothetical protein
MSMEERLADWTPARFIELVAKRSAGFANQAGVGAMETAGHLISYLADHPEHIEPWINGGFFELPTDWIEGGCLTYRAMNGKIVSPRYARQHRIIKRMEKSA